MIDARDKVQTALDTALVGTGVYVFWQRRVEIAGATNPGEYVVYTLAGDRDRAFADNDPLIKNAEVVVRYFYRLEMVGTQTGRTAIKARETALLAALHGAGFRTPNGAFDAGDIDDVGYFTSIIAGVLSRVA